MGFTWSLKQFISFICGLYWFYPVLPMGKTDCFSQFYPILPNWFYPLGKTTLPTLSATIGIGLRRWGKWGTCLPKFGEKIFSGNNCSKNELLY